MICVDKSFDPRNALMQHVPMSVEQVISELRQSGRCIDKPLFSAGDLQTAEQGLGIELPLSYKILLTTLEPEMTNFYFQPPARHDSFQNLIVFATWDEDQFAFDTERKMRVITLLGTSMRGREWEDFDGWLAHTWSMSNRPASTE